MCSQYYLSIMCMDEFTKLCVKSSDLYLCRCGGRLYFVHLGMVPNRCSHTLARVVFRRAQGAGRTQHQWVAAELDPVLAILFIGTFVLPLPIDTLFPTYSQRWGTVD